MRKNEFSKHINGCIWTGLYFFWIKKKVSGVQKGAGQSKGCTLVINIMYNFMNLKINIYN